MKNSLLHITEFRILLCGIFLSLLLLLLIGFYMVIDFETAKTLIFVLIINTFGGRAAGIGLCILNDFPALPTILYNFYIEAVTVCFTYSGFVLTTSSHLRTGWVFNLMNRLAIKAIEQKDRIEPYGWIGIFLFVMIPLPVTGPVIGSIMGYMLRLSLFKNLTASFLGTLTAIIIWFFCFDFLEQRFQMIQYLFVAIIILISIPYLNRIKNFIINKKNK